MDAVGTPQKSGNLRPEFGLLEAAFLEPPFSHFWNSTASWRASRARFERAPAAKRPSRAPVYSDHLHCQITRWRSRLWSVTIFHTITTECVWRGFLSEAIRIPN